MHQWIRRFAIIFYASVGLLVWLAPPAGLKDTTRSFFLGMDLVAFLYSVFDLLNQLSKGLNGSSRETKECV